MIENVLFVCNGPGEIHSLLRPLAQAFREALPQVRMTLLLSPSQFASGYEIQMAKSLGDLDEILDVSQFWLWLRRPKLAKAYFKGTGVVFAIAGELWHTRLINRALHWPQFAYLESPQWGGGFKKVFRSREENLMADLPQSTDAQYQKALAQQHLGFYVGSREAFMKHLVPFYELVILNLKQRSPALQTAFWVPEHLQKIFQKDFPQARMLQSPDEVAMMVTIVGTNTAVLSAKRIPMLVWLPLNWLDVIPLGGVLQWLGLKPLMIALSLRFSKRSKALPNILSGQVIVPEIVAKLTPVQLADQIWTHWQNPAALANMRGALVNILGNPGVAKRIVAALPSYLGVSWN
jgi:hypothetical protein